VKVAREQRDHVAHQGCRPRDARRRTATATKQLKIFVQDMAGNWADGRLIDMAVAPTLLSVLVPGDAPEGWGTVHATLRDAVHNTATADLPVYISGVLGPPPPVPVTPPTAPPQGVARHPVRKDFGESRARVRDDFKVQVALSSTSTLYTRSRYVTPRPRLRVSVTRAYLTSNYTMAVRPPVPPTKGRVRTADDIITRRGEGPKMTDELIALDLL
jgi:hypothetical protein